MGITAVVIHVSAGAALGLIGSASALRRRETNAGALAFAGMAALAVSALMLMHYAFWSDPSQGAAFTFAPDFFSPGRREQILWWYALAAAGIGAILVSAWARFRTSGRQA